MKRTISAMVGKGSVRHNSRQFNAENTDPERSHLNIEYCNENIRDVYKELFEDSRLRYNAKQKRADRCIDDYYEKICSGKQEKPFHELIIQIGNKDDCSSTTDEGKLVAEILDEYMKGFQERNPNLHVFSAHLHMDEATPHLHIDFVPYITGSNRGLDTRVSLKQALAELGFKGGTRKETEWNQWVNSEKEQLSEVMERHDMEWEHLGTHEEHLSVLDYKKQERAKEVAELEDLKSDLINQNANLAAKTEANEAKAEDAQKKAYKAERKMEAMTADIDQVKRYAVKYIHSPNDWLPEPNKLETARSYHSRILTFIEDNVVKIIRPLYASCIKFQEKITELTDQNKDLTERVDRLQYLLEKSEGEVERLKTCEVDLNLVKTVLGSAVVDDTIQTAKNHEGMVVRSTGEKQEKDRVDR